VSPAILRTLSIPLICATPALAGRGMIDDEASALERARSLAREEAWGAVAETLFDELRRASGDAALHGLLGQALFELERLDESAHWLATALEELPERDREAKRLRRRIRKADPHSRRREDLLAQIAKKLGQSAVRLHDEGHTERALGLAVRVESIARGDTRAEIRALLEEIRSRDRAVDFDDAASDERGAGGFPTLELESEHYELVVDLEPDVARLVADTMDDVFGHYVDVTFGGDWSAVSDRKATIRIHGTRDDMLAEWDRPDRTPGGWWSAGEWRVVTYDTRSTSNPPSLDSMLSTLYHEASHQFMTMRARGGSTPAWLNEGTASFFEGSKAMADHRVLWPQAATGRLLSVTNMLANVEDRPTLRDVIGYDEPASYEPIYYPFGWGVVYFLQEYEDETFARPYREPYLAYLDEITKEGGDPLALFERIVLGPDSPRPFESIEAFEEFWADWLTDVVRPRTFGDERSALRMQRARDYVHAADQALRERGVRRKTRLERHEDLLERALGQVEWVRTQFEADEVDGELLVLAADLYERLDREESTAPILEELLDRADQGDVELSDERYAEYEERLHRIDRTNAELRTARSRAVRFGRRARALLDDYEEAGAYTLRSYTLARRLGLVLDDPELLSRSIELRERARAAGLLWGSIHEVGGNAAEWITIFTEGSDTRVEIGDAIAIASTRPAGRVSTRVSVRGEYEVRCTLGRRGKLRRSTTNGVVVSGTKDGDWIVVGIDGRGRLALRRLDYGRYGGVVDETVRIERLRPGIEPVDVDLRVHCFPEGRLVVSWSGGDEIELEFGQPFPASAHVGAYAKDGHTEISNLVVELYP